MLDKVGYPGMKVLQFAFDDAENEHLPHNLKSSNYFAYTGTHDNETLSSWITTSSDKSLLLYRSWFISTIMSFISSIKEQKDEATLR